MYNKFDKLKRTLSENEVYLLEERAAIYQFEAGKSRFASEVIAYLDYKLEGSNENQK